ncbi:hypothetical protein A2311_03740 [candidate division WOR-1 bacterium RIFOXYB2_FULL_48_7]|uniref:DUF3298 domain-containing protein n=1 Tax=candidate division WOR-1 bacterium RIFOXYB2_FULL_48_7 TaxID=1802583 RepID=A0A1F4TF07_UNCSA|nr:MAG: hypothetical protein A2311_03740 [candidate division WOR-1 bacterium RIFOXYB2_FULL_48_7]
MSKLLGIIVGLFLVGNAYGAPQITAKVIKEQSNRYVIQAKYPYLSGLTSRQGEASFNQLIKGLVLRWLVKFKNDVRNYARFDLGQKSDFYADYQVKNLSKELIAVRIEKSLYQAGSAHPVAWIETINYDLVSGRQLQVEDIFLPKSDWVGLVASYCQGQLKQVLSSEGWVEEGAGEKADNYASFLLVPQGVVFIFQIYQVAPYAYGPQEVVVPYYVLQPMLKKRFYPL